jgi:tight adherence protein B
VIKRLRRRRWLPVPLALAALVATPAALAAVQLKSVDTSGFPLVRATLVAPAGSRTPVLREDGRPVSGYTAVNLGQQKAIVLAVDRSQSMKGRPLASAVSAAQSFLGAAGSHDHVGVVAFAHTAFALGALSDSPAGARSALASLGVDTRAGTALYDAIVLAANRLAGDERPGRAIVVVTDGRDVSSAHSLDDAIAAAHDARASVYTIGIGGPSFTPDALRTLAHETGGSYRQVARAADLGGIYRDLAGELDRTWQLSYATAARPGAKLALTARVANAGVAHATVDVAGDGTTEIGPSGLIPSAGYSTVGTLVVAGAVGLLILLSCCFWFASRRGSKLRARIEPHVAGVVRDPKIRHRRERAAARQRIADGVEGAFGNFRQFKSVQVMIERADLPLRAGELFAMAAGAAFVVGLLFAVAASSPLVILFAMMATAALPFLYVSFRAKSRIKKFDNQLADLLITIAASLKAGHSFRQGIQSVVDEGADPAAKEFRRVMTETQLGKPMDDALADLAARIDSKNLTFVINAVTIQRQIGGSLAGLFDMVAETVRQRQQFTRKVKGLTAMGRMSAYVLIGLPFFIASVVTLMNPTYMAPLYHSGTGQKLLATGLVMIVVGSTILKKMVSFRG